MFTWVHWVYYVPFGTAKQGSNDLAWCQCWFVLIHILQGQTRVPASQAMGKSSISSYLNVGPGCFRRSILRVNWLCMNHTEVHCKPTLCRCILSEIALVSQRLLFLLHPLNNVGISESFYGVASRGKRRLWCMQGYTPLFKNGGLVGVQATSKPADFD